MENTSSNDLAAEILECCLAGRPWSRATLHQLLEQATGTAPVDASRALFTKIVERLGDLFDGDWKWESPAQVRDALAAAGCQVPDTNDETLASLDYPLATLVRPYREASKRCTACGARWLSHVHPDGRIYPKWWQFGASSGRMSCSDPAMQQFPGATTGVVWRRRRAVSWCRRVRNNTSDAVSR